MPGGPRKPDHRLGLAQPVAGSRSRKLSMTIGTMSRAPSGRSIVAAAMQQQRGLAGQCLIDIPTRPVPANPLRQCAANERSRSPSSTSIGAVRSMRCADPDPIDRLEDVDSDLVPQPMSVFETRCMARPRVMQWIRKQPLVSAPRPCSCAAISGSGTGRRCWSGCG